jgi:uncharacterized glyoxalase superfamily protein PhnB
MSYKPSGYTSAAPYLIVADAEATLAFTAAVFGAEPLRVIRGDDGALRHAELRIDDTVVMVGPMGGGPEAHVHVYVDDPDAAFGRALAAGATPVQAVAVQDDGDRRGGVRDANGTTWWLGRAGG